ncbi:MAG: biotin/lipoyl-containing protein [Anaerolineae bacterium]
MLYTYQHDGTTYTVNLERQPDGTFQATISDGTNASRAYRFSAQQIAHGWHITTEAGRSAAYTAAQGDKRFVVTGGTACELRIPDERAARRKRSAGDHGAALTAQMPGQVRALLVSEGQSVTRGQTLVVLEAMKMEIRVTAPADGQVNRINVREGDVVERGQTLVEIESPLTFVGSGKEL